MLDVNFVGDHVVIDVVIVVICGCCDYMIHGEFLEVNMVAGCPCCYCCLDCVIVLILWWYVMFWLCVMCCRRLD